jgi:hypothetical protein
MITRRPQRLRTRLCASPARHGFGAASFRSRVMAFPERMEPVQRAHGNSGVFVILALLFALGACRNGTGQQTQTQTGTPLIESVPTVPPETPKSAAAPAESRDHEAVALGNQIPLTLKDGEAIRAALLERLEQSKLPERAMLIHITQRRPSSIENGRLRIGAWEIRQADGELTLQLMQPPSAGKHSRLWSAAALKEGDHWKVKNVEAGWIGWR